MILFATLPTEAIRNIPGVTECKVGPSHRARSRRSHLKRIVDPMNTRPRSTAASAASPGGTTASGRPDLLSPLHLAALGRLEFVARSVVDGFLIGLHRSPYRGFSVEFAENRPYYPGDDIRFVDWKMYGRSDRYYVKQFEEETNLRAYLLLDTSESMDWVSDEGRLVTKLAYARLLAASLSVLLLRQGDAVGMLAFDTEIRAHVAPRGVLRHLNRLVRELESLEGHGGTEAERALGDVAVRLRRRGLVVLISDLLVEPQATRDALHFLRHRGHEVLVFHLMDPAERELPPAGDALFYDPETGDELRTSSSALRREYGRAVEEAISDWRRVCRGMGADYEVVTTDTPIGRVLRRYFEKRARLG